jgi:hypothetical protein
MDMSVVWITRRGCCTKLVGGTPGRSWTARVDLRLGSVESLPAFEAPSDKILAFNTLMFWDQVDKSLKELRHLLRAGGRIALVHQPRGLEVTDATAKGDEMAAKLAGAGFSDVRTETLGLKPPVVCAIGVNPLEGQI